METFYGLHVRSTRDDTWKQFIPSMTYKKEVFMDRSMIFFWTKCFAYMINQAKSSQ